MPSRRLFEGEFVAQIQPQLLFQVSGRLRNHNRRNLRQYSLHFVKLRAALAALLKMLVDDVAISGIAIAVQHDLFLRQMFHFATLTSGSSCSRIFCTARKMLFLAALVLTFSALLISSTLLPSMWRMVKATRSAGLSRPMAFAIFCRASALSSSRSGPGSVAGIWISCSSSDCGLSVI